MSDKLKTLRGTSVGGHPDDETVAVRHCHLLKCHACGGWIDKRDLAQVLRHKGPLPHAEQDRER